MKYSFNITLKEFEDFSAMVHEIEGVTIRAITPAIKKQAKLFQKEPESYEYNLDDFFELGEFLEICSKAWSKDNNIHENMDRTITDRHTEVDKSIDECFDGIEILNNWINASEITFRLRPQVYREFTVALFMSEFDSFLDNLLVIGHATFYGIEAFCDDTDTL